MNELIPGQATRTLQIIVGTLAAGATTLLIVACVVEFEQATPKPILTYIATGFGMLMILLSRAVPGLMTRFAIGNLAKRGLAYTSLNHIAPSSEERHLYGVLAFVTIVSASMLESAALFAGVAYSAERELLALATAIVLIALLVTRIPTRMRVDAWIAEQSRILATKRSS